MSAEAVAIPEAERLVFAKALLWLPDGRGIFQRRAEDEAYGAGELGFFGGQVEPDDATPLDALRRELLEETDIPESTLDGLRFNSVGLPIMVEGKGGLLTHHLFMTVVKELFGAKEGQVEVHTLKDALEVRPSPVARYILQSLTANWGLLWR